MSRFACRRERIRLARNRGGDRPHMAGFEVIFEGDGSDVFFLLLCELPHTPFSHAIRLPVAR